MCIGMPAKIISIDESNADVDIMGLKSRINIELIEKLKVGDYVLVHGGCGISKINLQYFEELNNIFSSMLEEEKNG